MLWTDEGLHAPGVESDNTYSFPDTAPISQLAQVIGIVVLALLWMALLVFAAVVGME